MDCLCIDQSTGAPWGCYAYNISGADGTALGSGNQNTIDIVAGCAEAGTAARLCSDLDLNGYSDWYLPSKDELYKLYVNQAYIGGVAPYNYWSSSEVDMLNAWKLNFGNGSLVQPVPNMVPVMFVPSGVFNSVKA
jgi:hypothetical protein